MSSLPRPLPSLLRRRDVSILWTAGLVSWVGIYAMFVALPVMVYDRTSSPLATAVTVLGGALPSVLAGQVAGVIADRVDRRRLMIGALLAMAGLTLVYLPLADGPWWHLAVVNLINSSVGQLIGPAEHALLPELVEHERLGEAAALNALNNNLARLVGPALGGVLFTQAGWSASVVLNATTYLTAATLVALVSARRPHTPARQDRHGFGSEWLDGVRQTWGNIRLRILICLLALVAFGEGFVSALLAPLARELIGGGAQTLGWLLSAQAVGGIVGAWWATRAADRHDPLRLLGWAAVSIGLLLAVVFNYALFYPHAWPSVLLTGLAGVPFAVFLSAQLQALQLLAPPAARGRIFSLAWSAMGLAQLVGILLAGLGGEHWGVLVINVDAAAYLLAGVLALLLVGTGRLSVTNRPSTSGSVLSPDAQ